MPIKTEKRTGRNSSKSLARAGDTVPPDETWKLRLYVAGQTAKSLTALANLKQICEKYLPGKYDIEIVDLLHDPKLAKGDQILAVPTLVRKLPPPIRKIIGDLSNTDRVLIGLDVNTAEPGTLE